MTEADVERVAKAIREIQGFCSDEIARAAMAAMPPPADRWQPIETAPKDGTSVLAWEAESNMRCVAAFYSETDDGTIRWWKDQRGQFFKPTHWMPIPEPPK